MQGNALVAATAALMDEYDPARPNDYEQILRERTRKAVEEERRREMERRRREEEERERERELELKRQREVELAMKAEKEVRRRVWLILLICGGISRGWWEWQ